MNRREFFGRIGTMVAAAVATKLPDLPLPDPLKTEDEIAAEFDRIYWAAFKGPDFALAC